MTIYGTLEQCKKDPGFYKPIPKIYRGLIKQNETTKDNQEEEKPVKKTAIENLLSLSNLRNDSTSEFLRGEFPGFIFSQPQYQPST